ncbi:MAG: hypothetical protein KBG84_11780, partial [Planctomycetes bacterium]|nr:hypothetical protein [Planctomycetota bacterium]
MFKVITSKGPQGDYTREQIVVAVKRGKLSGKSVVLDSETGQYMEALDLFRAAAPTTERAPATPSASLLPSDVAASGPATQAVSQQREKTTSLSLVGIVVTALVLFAISAIITPWLIDSEQTTSTSTSGNSAGKTDLASEPRKPATSEGPSESKPTSRDDSTVENERWREEERKRLLDELTKKRDEATATERPPEPATPRTADSQPVEKPPQSAVDRFKEAAARFNPSIFLLYVAWQIRDGRGTAIELRAVAGTAWLAGDGLLVTNKHVLYPFLFNPVQCQA